MTVAASDAANVSALDYYILPRIDTDPGLLRLSDENGVRLDSYRTESLAAFSFAMVVSFIPVTAGGLGTVDASLTGLLAAFGANGSLALAVDIVWRAATFVPQVLTGASTFLWWRLTGGRRRRTELSGAGGRGR